MTACAYTDVSKFRRNSAVADCLSTVGCPPTGAARVDGGGCRSIVMGPSLSLRNQYHVYDAGPVSLLVPHAATVEYPQS